MLGASLRVKNVHKAFGGVVAVDDLSLEIGAGETVGVIGPNGAGKSTLLRLIAGEHRPDAGEIWLADRRLDHLQAHRIARAGVALAHQVPRPFRGLTVAENLRVAFTKLQFDVADTVNTNKKVELFTDTEQDGQVIGALWSQNAPEMGYKDVYHATFPVGTTDFSSFINKAKASGAQIVTTQMVPPDGVALWKQMKSLGYVPKLAFCEKCGNNGGWGQSPGSAGGRHIDRWVLVTIARVSADAGVRLQVRTQHRRQRRPVDNRHLLHGRKDHVRRHPARRVDQPGKINARPRGYERPTIPPDTSHFGATTPPGSFLTEKQWTSPTVEQSSIGSTRRRKR